MNASPMPSCERDPLAGDANATALPVLLPGLFAPLPRAFVSVLPDAFLAILFLQCAGCGTLNSRPHERIPTANQHSCWEDWGRAQIRDAALGSYAPMKTGVPISVTE